MTATIKCFRWLHCDLEGKLNMEFWMHKSGLHYFNPRDSKFTFVNTVSENKAGLMKRQVKVTNCSGSQLLRCIAQGDSLVIVGWLVKHYYHVQQ
jgi:hypothetical protein